MESGCKMMKTKIRLALLILKMNINRHLLAFIICLFIFNQVVTLNKTLIISANAALFSCFAFYEIESIDFSAGVIKLLGSIDHAELTVRIIKNIIFFWMNLILGCFQALFLQANKNIIYSMLTYCTCLSFWYFMNLILRNNITVFGFGIIYVFIWLVYYNRYLILYVNPFFSAFGNLTSEQLGELGIVELGLLIGSMLLQKNHYLQNFVE